MAFVWSAPTSVPGTDVGYQISAHIDQLKRSIERFWALFEAFIGTVVIQPSLILKKVAGLEIFKNRSTNFFKTKSYEYRVPTLNHIHTNTPKQLTTQF